MDLDKDLAARQEARLRAKEAAAAQKQLAQMTQQQLDAIVEAVAKAFSKEAAALAEMAVRETGFGNIEDKVRKNKFASETVAASIRGMKTVGVLKEGEDLWEIGVPVGVIAAIGQRTDAPEGVAVDRFGNIGVDGETLAFAEKCYAAGKTLVV